MGGFEEPELEEVRGQMGEVEVGGGVARFFITVVMFL